MAASTRLVDHPTDPTKWLVQHVADIPDEGKVVIAEVAVERSMDIGSCIKRGEYIMGEWLLAKSDAVVGPWLEEVSADIKKWLTFLQTKREMVAAAANSLQTQQVNLVEED